MMTRSCGYNRLTLALTAVQRIIHSLRRTRPSLVGLRRRSIFAVPYQPGYVQYRQLEVESPTDKRFDSQFRHLVSAGWRDELAIGLENAGSCSLAWAGANRGQDRRFALLAPPGKHLLAARLLETLLPPWRVWRAARTSTVRGMRSVSPGFPQRGDWLVAGATLQLFNRGDGRWTLFVFSARHCRLLTLLCAQEWPARKVCPIARNSALLTASCANIAIAVFTARKERDGDLRAAGQGRGLRTLAI